MNDKTKQIFRPINNCPFCQSDRINILYYSEGQGDRKEKFYYLICSSCSQSGPRAKTDIEAAKQWNAITGAHLKTDGDDSSSNCSICMFSRIQRLEENHDGENFSYSGPLQCRFSPPFKGLSNWPEIHPDDWCGSFKRSV